MIRLKYDQDEYINGCWIGRPIQQLADIPDALLMAVLDIRGYMGRLVNKHGMYFIGCSKEQTKLIGYDTRNEYKNSTTYV